MGNETTHPDPAFSPDGVHAKLRSVARRWKMIAAARGLLTTAAAAAGCLLLLVAIDAGFVFYGQGVRTFLWAGAIAIVALTAYATIGRPLARKLPPAKVARAIEASDPGVGESLSTALEIAQARKAKGGAPGSLELAVLDDAGRNAEKIRTSRAAPARRLRPALVTALALGAVGGGAFWLWPEVSRHLLERAAIPFTDGGNIHARQLQISPGDTQIPAGKTLRIEVEIEGAESATLRRKIPGGADAIERMAPMPTARGATANRFVLAIPAVDEPFEYRIQSGRALSRYFAVDVAPLPDLVDQTVILRFPEHTGLGDSEPGWDGQVVAPAGTIVEFAATLREPVKLATLIADGAPIWNNRQSLDPEGRTVVNWEFTLLEGTDGSLSVQLESLRGLNNTPLDVPLRAVSDVSPQVEITSPSASTRGLTVLPTDTLPIRFLAREDYAISTAQLIVEANGNLLPPRELDPPKASAERGVFSGSTTLDLEPFELADGTKLEIRIGVADNNPDNPGAGLSEPLVLTIDSRSESLLSQKITLAHTGLHDSIWDAIEKLAEAKPVADKLPGALAAGGEMPQELLADLSQIAELAGAAAALADQAANSANGSPFADIAPALENIAKEQLEKARAAAEAVPLQDREAGRVHQARVAQRNIEEASAELGEVLRDLKQTADRERIAAELGELEEQRQELAAQGEDTGPLDELRNKLLEASAKTLAEQLGGAEELAGELAKRAAELAGDQENLSRLMELAKDLGAREQLVTELMKWLGEEQSGIAEKAAELAKELAGEVDLEAVAREAAKAAESLSEGLAADAAQAAAESAAALENLPPELAAQFAELGDLAEWQRRIADQAESFAGGDIEATLSGMQAGITELAAELAAESGQFEQLIQALADPENAMRAVEALQALAENAERTGAASESLEGAAPDFAAALEALGESDADLRAAAEALAAASESLGREAGAPVAEREPEPMTPEAAMRRREELLADGSWTTTGGTARGDLESVARGEPPARYRDMVSRYFEAIAAAEEGAADSE